MNTIDVVFIALVVICYVLAFSKRAQKLASESKHIVATEKGISRIVTTYYWVLLVAVIIVAVAARLWKFGVIPYGFNQDEAMAALEGLSLAENGTDHYGMVYPVYFTAWITHQMNVLLSYILAVLFKLFGPSIFLARLPLLIFSFISLYVVYRFSYKAFGKNAALVILFVTAINPWQIMTSRWALEANVLPHLLLYGCYLIYLGTEKKRYTYISMIFFGLAMYAYGIAYYLVPILLLALCVYLVKTKAVRWYDIVGCAAIYALISWPIFAMMFINFFRIESIELPFMTIPFFEKGERLNDILFFSENILKQLGENFLYVILFVLLQTRDRLWNSIPEIGPFYFVAIPLLILGFAFFVDEIRKKESKEKKGIIIVLLLFAASFISGLITNNVNLNRMNAIAYPVLFMVGYAIYQIIKRLKITIIPIVLIFAVLFGSFFNAYFYGDFSSRLGKEFYSGFVEAVSYVKNVEYERLYITEKTQGEQGGFTSEILTQFLLEIDVGYSTGEHSSESECLPYEEKYQYGITESMIDEDEVNIIYIVRTDELVMFEKDIYDIITFQDYCVVTHKQWDGASQDARR